MPKLTLEQIRLIIEYAFKDPTSLDAWLVDHFIDVYQQLSSGMTTDAKITYLLTTVDNDRILISFHSARYRQRFNEALKHFDLRSSLYHIAAVKALAVFHVFTSRAGLSVILLLTVGFFICREYCEFWQIPLQAMIDVGNKNGEGSAANYLSDADLHMTRQEWPDAVKSATLAHQTRGATSTQQERARTLIAWAKSEIACQKNVAIIPTIRSPKLRKKIIDTIPEKSTYRPEAEKWLVSADGKIYNPKGYVGAGAIKCAPCICPASPLKAQSCGVLNSDDEDSDGSAPIKTSSLPADYGPEVRLPQLGSPKPAGEYDGDMQGLVKIRK